MIAKLEGLIEAIEAEWKQPAPSHGNLARLVALALRELDAIVEATKEQPIPCAEQPESNVDVAPHQPKKRLKNSKS